MQQNRTNEILCVAKSQFALHTPYIRPEILGNGSAAWNRYCNILTIAAKKNAVNNAENLHRDYNEITKTQFNCDKLHSFVPRKCTKRRIQIQLEHFGSHLIRTPRQQTHKLTSVSSPFIFIFGCRATHFADRRDVQWFWCGFWFYCWFRLHFRFRLLCWFMQQLQHTIHTWPLDEYWVSGKWS